MPLTGEAKRLYQREYMRKARSNNKEEKREAGRLLRVAVRKGQVVKAERCEACGSREYLIGHHPDYDKPLEVLWVCSGCHRKLHLKIDGGARTKSKPYKNPLDKIARKREKVQPSNENVKMARRMLPIQMEAYAIANELDADGNPIYEGD